MRFPLLEGTDAPGENPKLINTTLKIESRCFDFQGYDSSMVKRIACALDRQADVISIQQLPEKLASLV